MQLYNLTTIGDPLPASTSAPRSATPSFDPSTSLLQVHVIPVGPLACNCVIIGDPVTKEALIVDPGGDAQLILSWVHKLGYQVIKHIYHTHAHFDHFLASAELKESLSAKLCLHSNDVLLWQNLDKQAQLMGLKLQPNQIPERPDVLLAGDEPISVGSATGKTIHTPGHSPGSICYAFGDYDNGQEGKEDEETRPPVSATNLSMNRFVLTGDTLFRENVGRTDLWGGSFPDLKQSIRSKLYALPNDTVVIPGHGPITTIGWEKKRNWVVKDTDGDDAITTTTLFGDELMEAPSEEHQFADFLPFRTTMHFHDHPARLLTIVLVAATACITFAQDDTEAAAMGGAQLQQNAADVGGGYMAQADQQQQQQPEAAIPPAPPSDLLPVSSTPPPPLSPETLKGIELYTQATQVLTSLSSSSDSTTSRQTRKNEEGTQDYLLVFLKSMITNVFKSLTGGSNWLEVLLSSVNLGFESSEVVQDVDTEYSSLEESFAEGGQEKVVVPVIEGTDAPAVKRAKAVRMLEVAGYHYGNHDALLYLGDMHLLKRAAHPRRAPVAFKHYLTLAQKHGNATAQRMVGLMYATGIGTPRDYVKALLYMSFAAMAHDTIAQQTLGYWHLTGISTAKSCEDAVWYYKMVADKAIEKFKSGPPGGLALPRLKSRLSDSSGGVYGPGASGPGSGNNVQQSHLAQQHVREIYEIQADEGDASIQISLGKLYYHGSIHTPRNFKKAHRLFLQAAKSYSGPRPAGEISHQLKQRIDYAAVASGYLGMMYWRGEGVGAEDPVTARQWFERGEELDNPMSLNGLGMMHRDGVAGFTPNTQKAYSYFAEAAQRDNSEAQVNIAEMILRSGSKDAYTQSFKYFTAATSKPPANLMGLYRLGEMNAAGLGTPANCAIGVGYLKSVVERGDWKDPTIEWAQEYYRRGDVESALMHYMFAAERGVEIAQSNAAYIIDKGLYSFGGANKGRLFYKDINPYEAALVLWNRAANQGNVDARVKMGDYHYFGLGIDAGKGEAAKKSDGETPLKKKEGVMEWLLSMSFLGKLYKMVLSLAPPFFLKDGVVTEPNYEKAALYYQVAADEYSALAQWNMGFMHENGIGVAQDYPLAKRMYDLSLATNPDAYLPVNLALIKLGVKYGLHFIVKQFSAKTGGTSFAQTTKVPHDPSQHIPGNLPPSALKDELGKLKSKAAWDGLEFEIPLVIGVAAIVAMLFIWRQAIAQQELVRRQLATPAPAAPAPGVPVASPPVGVQNQTTTTAPPQPESSSASINPVPSASEEPSQIEKAPPQTTDTTSSSSASTDPPNTVGTSSSSSATAGAGSQSTETTGSNL
ncbi:ERAD-associated protein [Chytridiales sp. JEL 0842]|nr:ERAD-associated protein [Chytridiales sp. JEL 0842]